jgi:hypothetical protein
MTQEKDMMKMTSHELSVTAADEAVGFVNRHNQAP